jgi:hypothetical protein
MSATYKKRLMVTFNFASLSTDKNEEDKHKLIQLYKIKSITKIKAYVIITNIILPQRF